MNLSFLDNIFWHTLAGPHAPYAAGAGGARRYARGFSPIVAFAEPQQPDFATLARFREAGESLYYGGGPAGLPAGWRVVAESTMFCMVWDAPAPVDDEAPEALPLGAPHAAQALELASLTRPGPFGPRTIELGEYFGCFDGRRLVAMAGERMFAGTLREISGVCTHPDAQGRGFARRLMHKLIRRQAARGETPFLHVMRENTGARAVRAHGLPQPSRDDDPGDRAGARRAKGRPVSVRIGMLAALSHHGRFSVGCHCADGSHCHGSVLRALLQEAGAEIGED